MSGIASILTQRYATQLGKIPALEGQIGYRFTNRDILVEALTHSSVARSLQLRHLDIPLKWNERLEFLGDAVLGLCISSDLSSRPEMFAEGELSRIRSSLVNEKTLSEIGNTLGIGDMLIISKGEENNGGRNKRSLIADAVEAIIGAIYVDGGFVKADQAVQTLFRKHLAIDLKTLLKEDHKTRLQELTQKINHKIPSYQIINEDGPDHQVVFTVEVIFDGLVLGTGIGSSKKAASQAAAQAALANPDLTGTLEQIATSVRSSH